MRLLAFVVDPFRWCVFALLLVGCRAEVDGVWRGHVGGEDATLTLEQAGADLVGSLCVAHTCGDVDGSVVDERVELGGGCERCALRDIELDLQVTEDRLDGWAFVGDAAPVDVSLHRR